MEQQGISWALRGAVRAPGCHNLSVLWDLSKQHPFLSLPLFFPLLPPHPTLLAFPPISSLIICSKPVPFPLQWVEPLGVSEPWAQRLWGEQHPAMQQQQPLHARLLGPHPQRRAVCEGNSAEGLPLTPTLQPSVPHSKRMWHEHDISAFQRP